MIPSWEAAGCLATQDFHNIFMEPKGSLPYSGLHWSLSWARSIKFILPHPISSKNHILHIKKTPWSESVSELYRSSDHRLSAKWLPTFADRGCHVVSVTSLRLYSRFSRQEPLLFYQVAPQFAHEAEWTPFQTHYFFFLVVPGIEPGPPAL
jgi:hypothetical protein